MEYIKGASTDPEAKNNKLPISNNIITTGINQNFFLRTKKVNNSLINSIIFNFKIAGSNHFGTLFY